MWGLCLTFARELLFRGLAFGDLLCLGMSGVICVGLLLSIVIAGIALSRICFLVDLFVWEEAAVLETCFLFRGLVLVELLCRRCASCLFCLLWMIFLQTGFFSYLPACSGTYTGTCLRICFPGTCVHSRMTF